MNDLIFRQDAITKLREAEYVGTLKDEGGYVQRHRDFVEMYKIIRDLPSAQQWIPCSERLPEKEGRYWVWAEREFTPDHANEPNTFQGSTEASFLSGKWYGSSIAKVFAWMPLPDPYPWKGEA